VNAKQANNTIDAARELQRALYRAAKASATRRFHALYDKVYRKDILARAWREVKANAGAAGIDGATIETIEQDGVEGFLAKLGVELREGRYRPQPVRRVYIPKADGRKRPLGIPVCPAHCTSKQRGLGFRAGWVGCLSFSHPLSISQSRSVSATPRPALPGWLAQARDGLRGQLDPPRSVGGSLDAIQAT